MKTLNIIVCILLLSILFYSCETNQPPICEILTPSPNAVYSIGDSISISVEASDPGGNIREVQLYFDGDRITSMKESPYTFMIGTDDYTAGEHEVKSAALDDEGLESTDEIQIILNAVQATIRTSAVSSVEVSSAVSGGTITSDGGAMIISRGICWSELPNPTISNDHTDDGTGIGEFSSKLTGLEVNTIYYVKAYVMNSIGITYGNEEIFTTLDHGETLTDIDGNTYRTVQIGNQLWMAENLRTTRYADESAIPLVEGAEEWIAFTAIDKAYCWYDNTTTNRDSYGGLYTWAAAMNGGLSSDTNPSVIQGACPDGWHLPSDSEWKELETYLGMSQAEADLEGMREANVAVKLKATTWGGGTNESGFSALPGGFRFRGEFMEMGDGANFWSATEDDPMYIWLRGLTNYTGVLRFRGVKFLGHSVRCVGN